MMYCKERYMKNNPRAAKRALCSLFWGDILHYTVHVTQLCAQWKSVESLHKMTLIYCTGSIKVPQSNTDILHRWYLSLTLPQSDTSALQCETEALQYHLCSIYRGLWGLVVVRLSYKLVAQWQSTGCTSQASWVRFLATAGLFTFLYFRLKNI